MKTKLLLVLLTVLGGVGCRDATQAIYDKYHEQVDSVGTLTDEMVVRYVKTYALLRERGQSYLGLLQGSKESGPVTGLDGFNVIEGDIKKGGFKSYAEFVKVNAKIAWAWNVAQGQVALAKTDVAEQRAQAQLSDGEQQLIDALKNPELPAEARKELERALRELRGAKVTVADEVARNRRWADVAMHYVSPLTSKADMQVIMRHEQELLQVFTGMTATQLEQVQQAALRELDVTRGK